MKKRTISKLKSIFSSKKGKRQLQQEQASKSSRSPSPEPVRAASPATNGDSFRQLLRTPPPPVRVGPPPSPPVPTHPVAPVAPEPSGPLPLLPCAVCGRTFVPQSLAKHIKICEKMTVKKRKTFDSSRQRREGTDLEQYLPKNFGLPENSPFLEKSPPPTAKPTPKPKPQSVRSAMTKPMAELQRCPHCNRAFGVRAFERHVEWCADKAKILPAAPTQPPPHIADAKQRLNARTQYKAPLARGRRSSQTREKSSNSRSTSVDSSRGGASPPPREYGDYKHSRTRASESVSSNDCHDDPSPHMPVIRNSRNSLNKTSGDANVKARQARLARDLSSSRQKQEPRPNSVQQSNTDPNIKKNITKQKPKNVFNAKQQQQLKKLEQLTNKYNQKSLHDIKESSHTKSRLPVIKKINKTVNQNEVDKRNQSSLNNRNEENNKELITQDTNVKKRSKNSLNPQSEVSLGTNITLPNTYAKVKNKRETGNRAKETSMSLDSLDDNSNDDRICQSIGINTELQCVPCVIHDSPDQKKTPIKNDTTEIIIHDNLDQKKTATKSNLTEIKYRKPRENKVKEPPVEVLYKNPTMTHNHNKEKYKSNVTVVKDIDSHIDYNNSVVTLNTSGMINSDVTESITNFNTNIRHSILSPRISEETESKLNFVNSSHKLESNADIECEKFDEVIPSLSEERFEEDYEHDVSAEFSNDSIENKYDEGTVITENGIECRHGSGETYTMFTENPADLEEFMTLTDKLLNDGPSGEGSLSIGDFHTPKTNSMEAIYEADCSLTVEPPKYKYSDTFEELKCNLKELLESASNKTSNDLPQKLIEINNDEENINESGADRNVCDMEHITVYQLKFYDKKIEDMPPEDKFVPEFKLPLITELNKSERREFNKKKMPKNYKPNRKYKMLSEQIRNHKDYKTFIVDQSSNDNSDGQSISSEAPPLKLPRIEIKRLDDNYDPFASAARQMKELMSSETNIPKKIHNSTNKDHSRTLPALQTNRDKGTPSYLRSDSTKMMKDTLNKTYQKTPTLQRMKSFGSTNNENTNSTLGGRCSSFRLNRNDKKPTPKLNTTFTKSSKENISTTDKNYFNRNSNLNRSFSSYSASCYSTPKPKDKIPKIATSMYHSFQRTTIKQPVKLDKIKRDDVKKDFVNLDAILTDDNSSMTDSNYIDPRLINENDNLPINVNTILNNPDIISSMESLLTTENLPANFESFNSVNQSNHKNNINNNNNELVQMSKNELNNNVNHSTAPTVDDLNMQYDKLMYSLEQSIASKTSIRDDDSLCEEFDLEEFMTSFDDEIHKHKSENKRTCSSTTRIVKHADIADSNRASELNSVSSTPKVRNGMSPVNKSMSLNFSSNNIASESLFPSSVKRSTSLLDSIQKKTVMKSDSGKFRHKSDQLEQDIMQSLKDFDKFYEFEKSDIQPNRKETIYSNGTARRDIRAKSERKIKKNENISNGKFTPNGKSSNDSAYSSLNRLSPSKLSLVNSKEPNGSSTLDQIPAGSDSSHKEDMRSMSSDEFLAMERSAELNEPISPPAVSNKEPETTISEKRSSSRTSRHGSGWRGPSLSSSGSEASLSQPRLSRFCHECGNKFPVDTAKFCILCGVKRLVV